MHVQTEFLNLNRITRHYTEHFATSTAILIFQRLNNQMYKKLYKYIEQQANVIRKIPSSTPEKKLLCDETAIKTMRPWRMHEIKMLT